MFLTGITLLELTDVVVVPTVYTEDIMIYVIMYDDNK